MLDTRSVPPSVNAEEVRQLLRRCRTPTGTARASAKCSATSVAQAWLSGAIAINAAYASVHSHRFRYVQQQASLRGGWARAWNKVFYLQERARRGVRKGRCHWMLLLDSDAFVHSPTIPLSSYLADVAARYHLPASVSAVFTREQDLPSVGFTHEEPRPENRVMWVNPGVLLADVGKQQTLDLATKWLQAGLAARRLRHTWPAEMGALTELLLPGSYVPARAVHREPGRDGEIAAALGTKAASVALINMTEMNSPWGTFVEHVFSNRMRGSLLGAHLWEGLLRLPGGWNATGFGQHLENARQRVDLWWPIQPEASTERSSAPLSQALEASFASFRGGGRVLVRDRQQGGQPPYHIFTFAAGESARTLCNAFAERARSLDDSLAASVMSIELRGAADGFLNAVEAKLRIMTELLKLVRVPFILADCDIVLLREEVVTRLLHECRDFSICLMLDESSPAHSLGLRRTRRGQARLSAINSGLLVVSQPSAPTVGKLFRSISTNLTLTLQRHGVENTTKLLPLGDQTLLQQALRSDAHDELTWGVYGQKHVGLGCLSVPTLQRDTVLVAHATLQRLRKGPKVDAARKLACMREMQRWVANGTLQDCTSAWAMPHQWLTSAACRAACPQDPADGLSSIASTCVCRDRSEYVPACKRLDRRITGWG